MYLSALLHIHSDSRLSHSENEFLFNLGFWLLINLDIDVHLVVNVRKRVCIFSPKCILSSSLVTEHTNLAEHMETQSKRCMGHVGVVT